MQNQKGNTILISMGIIAFIIWISSTGYLITKNLIKKEQTHPETQQQAPIPEIEKQQRQGMKTTDETADWKTYKNEKYGFEFRYPQDWQFCDAPHPVSDSERSQTNDICVNGGGTFDIRVENPKDWYGDKCTTLSDCVKIYPGDGGEITDQRNITLSNLDAISQKVERKQYGWMYFQTFLIKEGYLYRLKLGTAYNKTGGETTYEQILSTFKFINQDSSESTETLKIDSQTNICGVNIKVPSFTTKELIKDETFENFSIDNRCSYYTLDYKYSVSVFDITQNNNTAYTREYSLLKEYQDTHDKSLLTNIAKSDQFSTGINRINFHKNLFKNDKIIGVGYTAQIFQDFPGTGVYQAVFPLPDKLVYITYSIFNIEDKSWQDYLKSKNFNQNNYSDLFDDYMNLSLENPAIISNIEEINNTIIEAL